MVPPIPYPFNPTSTTTAIHTQIRTRPNPTSTTMAQREEEAELRLPEAPAALCANNCGFRGNPATNNLCQSCYSSATRRPSPPIRERPRSVAIRRDEAAAAESAEVTPPPPVKLVERCAGCKRRVGLTGIRCRCGELYCAVHRYTDRHECSYDYKAAGREAIARENPAVRAAKIVRI